jgi:hypothetical protein
MKEKQFEQSFECFKTSKEYSIYLGIRTCARYNRGEECNLGRIHTTHKPDWQENRPHQPSTSTEPTPRPRKNEMRLHSCTLCMEALGSAHGHSVLNCPWILQKNWKKNN